MDVSIFSLIDECCVLVYIIPIAIPSCPNKVLIFDGSKTGAGSTTQQSRSVALAQMLLRITRIIAWPASVYS